MFKPIILDSSAEINSSNLENYRICTRTEPNPLKQIKQVLNLLNRKEPIGFSYQSKVLYDKEIYKEKGRVQTNHVSVIVGKRVRNNKCELLVKNSWGNYCGYDWECQKDARGREIGLWTDAKILLSQTPHLFYLEKKSRNCF